MGVLSRFVDFVGEDAIVNDSGESLVETDQELAESLTIAATEHDVGVRALPDHGHGAGWWNLADGHSAVFDKFAEVRKGERRVLPG